MQGAASALFFAKALCSNKVKLRLLKGENKKSDCLSALHPKTPKIPQQFYQMRQSTFDLPGSFVKKTCHPKIGSQSERAPIGVTGGYVF